MKSVRIGLIVLLFLPLVLGSVHCTNGKEPETVIVPVGESGNSNPYDSGGDFGCGSSTKSAGAAEIWVAGETEPMALLTFIGTSDVWRIMVTSTEYDQIRTQLQQVYTAKKMASMSSTDLAKIQADLCKPAGDRSQDGQRVYDILKGVLQSRMDGIEAGICQ